ncbi:ubiquitin-like protein 7 [Bacillus rossius redtenbacheri]|uniref:ubiquitin-like protein 7 n=1 Tax=Bacillus rossius redtenbacheri TaxID=93214 RepID=UPI002FDEC046
MDNNSLVLGVRLSLNSFQRVKIDGINFDSKVDHLRAEVSKQTSVPKQLLVLIYCGNVLNDGVTLRSCGLKPGVMVHVLKSKETMVHGRPSPTEGDIQELVTAFRSFARNHSLRSALQRLTRPEVLENVLMATPSLREDPVAMGIIQDPELLVHLEDITTVRKLAEQHPHLVEAANHIAAAVHEEAAAGTATSQASTSGYSYSVDALSDDDEMDSSQSSDSMPRGESLSRQHSYSTITAAQLAAALASATGIFPPTRSSSTSSNPGPSGSGPVITPEMFSQAMEQAIATVGSSGGQESPLPADEPAAAVRPAGEGWAVHLQQMRELGLTDDAVNIQALEATGGDVQAAINLVFSGSLGPGPL